MRFRILCVDTSEDSGIGDVKAFADKVKEWKSEFAQDGEDSGKVVLVGLGLKLTVKKFVFDSAVADNKNAVAFMCTAECGDAARDVLGTFRKELVSFAKDTAKFSVVRVMRDDVSKSIGAELYPFLYETENKMRSLIARVCTSKFGTGWFSVIDKGVVAQADSNRDRSRGTWVFDGKVEADIIFAEFSGISTILCNSDNRFIDPSGNTRSALDAVNDLVRRIMSGDDFDTLRKELRSVYGGMFGGEFASGGFATDWTRLYAIRNKVAHHRYLSLQDGIDGKALCNKLCTLADDYDHKHEDDYVDETQSHDVASSQDEKHSASAKVADAEAAMKMILDRTAIDDEGEGIEEGVSSDDDYEQFTRSARRPRILFTPPQQFSPSFRPSLRPRFRHIDEDTLLEELHVAQMRGREFVGLSDFVKNVLGDKGYDISYSYAMVNYLEAKGVVRLCKRHNPNNEDHPVTAISFVSDDEGQ